MSHFVPAAIEHLTASATEDDATAACWELDNRVVVQGQLFEAAEAIAHELVDRLCVGSVSTAGGSRALDLLVEIAYGESDSSEVALGNRDLGTRCRDVIQKGLVCMRASAAEDDDRARAAIDDIVDRLGSHG